MTVVALQGRSVCFEILVTRGAFQFSNFVGIYSLQNQQCLFQGSRNEGEGECWWSEMENYGEKTKGFVGLLQILFFSFKSLGVYGGYAASDWLWSDLESTLKQKCKNEYNDYYGMKALNASILE